MKYSEIRGKDVVDSNGEKVGEIMDLIFNCSDNKIDLKYMVLGGGRIEELLEAIGARPDIDPVCNLDSIEKIEDKVYLNVDRESLKKTLDPGVIGENDITFSALSDIKIIDSDDFKIGFVIDVWLDNDGVMWLVLGGGFFEELLERLHVQPDIDLLIPPHFIETLNSDEIKLNVSKFNFESTTKDEHKKLKKKLEGEDPPDDARYSQLKLGG